MRRTNSLDWRSDGVRTSTRAGASSSAVRSARAAATSVLPTCLEQRSDIWAFRDRNTSVCQRSGVIPARCTISSGWGQSWSRVVRRPWVARAANRQAQAGKGGDEHGVGVTGVGMPLFLSVGGRRGDLYGGEGAQDLAAQLDAALHAAQKLRIAVARFLADAGFAAGVFGR